MGFFRSLILLFFLGMVLARANTLEPPQTYVLGFVLITLLASLHTVRKDKAFLHLLDFPTYPLYLVEYHLLASPVYSILLFKQDWIVLAVTCLLVSIIPLLDHIPLHSRIKITQGGATGLSFIPVEAFEWKSGLRKHGLLIGLLYLLAIVLFQYPFVALLVIVVFTFLVTTFYNESEPRQMLEAFALPPRQLLWMKWKLQLKLFWIGCLPLALIFLINIPEYWYVLPVWIVVCSVIQLLSINLKYTFYEPGLSLNNDIFMFIYFLSLFVPFFFPVPLVMMLRYYRRAHLNLQTYLHDSY